MIIERFLPPMRDVPLPLPKVDRDFALFFLKKNLPSFVWNTLRILENNPTSLPDTSIILQGRTVSGMRIDDMVQVKNFGDAAKFLADAVTNDSFALSIPMACGIHKFTGKEEALEWGQLRKHQVHVGDCTYIPPAPEEIPPLLQGGFDDLNGEFADPIERALNTFAFMSKLQPFYDANKRTAILMMNGVLISNGFHPLFIPAKAEAELNTALTGLYENGNSDPLKRVFCTAAESLYPLDVDYGERYAPGLPPGEEDSALSPGL